MTTRQYPVIPIKRGDTLPTATIYVTDANGDPLDLTDVTSAVFKMYTDNQPRVEKVSAAANVVSPATGGAIEYGWAEADTDTAGEYLAEVTLTFTDGGILTYPTEGFYRVRVWDNLQEEE